MMTNMNLANLNSASGFSVKGHNIDDNSGWSVSGAVDVNGDGYDDIIIGAPYADNEDLSDTGVTYVIYGGSSLSSIDLSKLTADQGIAIYGGVEGGLSGWSVSGAGDINKDGYGDIIIGAPHHQRTSLYTIDSGKTYIIFGKSSLSNINLNELNIAKGITIYGTSFGSGSSVSGAGDVNGDGFADIIIGEPNTGEYHHGIAYVIFGKASFSTNIYLSSLSLSQGFSFSGKVGGYDNFLYLGFSVSGAGDVNKDGYDDVIVSTEFKGKSYVIYGTSSPANLALNYRLSIPSSSGYSIFGENWAGYSVSGVGDVNGDGYDDVIVGNPHSGIGNRGMSYLIHGKSSPRSDIDLSSPPIGDFLIYGANAEDNSGTSVSGAGDFNGDGYNDFIINTNFYYDLQSDSWFRGKSYLIYGGKHTDNMDLSTITPSQGFYLFHPNESMSSSARNAGDINGDGWDDIIIGSSGASYIIYGNGSSSSTFKPTLFPTSSPDFISYVELMILSGGTHNGTTENENFFIDSPEDTILSGGGGKDMYTLIPHSSVTTTITDFNIDSDIINLSAFKLNNFNELNITAGSIIINLEESQKIRLLDLIPGDIDSNNFIFTEESIYYEDPKNDQQAQSSDTSLVIGIAAAAAGAVILGAIGCWQYNKCHNKVHASDLDGVVP